MPFPGNYRLSFSCVRIARRHGNRGSANRCRDRLSSERSIPACCCPDRASVAARRKSSRSALLNRILREDILDPLERLLGGLLRGHASLDNVGPAGLPDMLVLDLGI